MVYIIENGEWRIENGKKIEEMENGEWRMENLKKMEEIEDIFTTKGTKEEVGFKKTIFVFVKFIIKNAKIPFPFREFRG